MDELLQLREYIEAARYTDALLLIDELEEMARDDKINKIYSYSVILLVHLIKRHAEDRTTASWDASIANALRGIARANKRRKAGGYYIQAHDIREILQEAFDEALTNAALEAFGGLYSPAQLAPKFDTQAVFREAETMIAKTFV